MTGESLQDGLIMRQLFDYETWTYTYILADPEHMDEAILIDSVKEQVDRDISIINEMGLTLKYLLETHVHADHITGAHDMREKIGVQVVYGSGANVPCADIDLADGEELSFGRYTIKAFSNPGHTDGCTNYYIKNMVFTGDTLLIRGCGRTDFQQGSSDLLFKSVREKLFSLPDDTFVYPAHDYKGRCVSTIAEEKQFNPRLGLDKTKEEFTEIMSNLNLAYPKKIDVSVPANMKCGNTTD